MRKHNNGLKRLERLLARKGYMESSRRPGLLDGEWVLYFGSEKQAIVVRAYLIHERMAAEQWRNRVSVYVNAQEEVQRYKGKGAAA